MLHCPPRRVYSLTFHNQSVHIILHKAMLCSLSRFSLHSGDAVKRDLFPSTSSLFKARRKA